MKLIKKLTTILFAFMMVLSATTMVFAENSGSIAGGTKGKITINNAINDQEYKVYQILKLESFDSTAGRENGLYAYKVVTGWKDFLATTDSAGAKFLIENKDGYVEWNGDKTPDRIKEFAEKALAYAKDPAHSITALTGGTEIPNAGGKTKTITYTDLELGYYLVDSSVGSLCSLDTTDNEVNIVEKNSVPTVEKLVSKDNGTTYDSAYNSASLGDTVHFQTTINVGAGAENYVLHDKMGVGLDFNKLSLTVKVNGVALADGTDFNLKTDALGDDCTFHIEFVKYDKLVKDAKVVVTYNAKLTDKAINDSHTPTSNSTHLIFGDNKTSNKEETHTHTNRVPVFKHYVDNASAKKGLAGAAFSLRKDDQTTKLSLVKLADKTDTAGNTVQAYRLALDGETSIDTITTDANGYFEILGLKEGTYYLKEETAPKGYNVLKNMIKVEIDTFGMIKYDGANLTGTAPLYIPVENKSGTVLPSTGGVGTTMMYIVGAALLIGSGVLLITKKNAK